MMCDNIPHQDAGSPCSSTNVGGDVSPVSAGDTSRNLQDALQSLGDHLQHALQEKTTALLNTQRENKTLKKELSSQRKKVQELSTELADSHKGYNDLLTKFSDQDANHAETVQQYQKQTQLLEQQLQQQREENGQLQQALAGTGAAPKVSYITPDEMENMQAALAQKDKQISELLASLHEATQQQPKPLQQLQKRAEEDQQRTKDECEALGTKVEQLQEALETQKTADELMSAELQSLQNRNHELELQLTALNGIQSVQQSAEIEALLGELQQLREKNKELREAVARTALLENELEEMKNVVHELQGQGDRARARTEHTQHLLVDMQKRWASERQQLLENRNKAEAEAEAAAAATSAANKALTDLETQQGGVSGELAALRKQLQKEQEETAAAVLAANKATENVNQLEDEVAKLQQTVDQLSTEKSKQKQQLDKSQSDIDKLTINLDNARGNTVKISAERDANENILQKQLTEAQTREAQLEEKVRQSNSWIKELEDANKGSKDKTALLNRDVLLLKEALAISERKNQHYRGLVQMASQKQPQQQQQPQEVTVQLLPSGEEQPNSSKQLNVIESVPQQHQQPQQQQHTPSRIEGTVHGMTAPNTPPQSASSLMEPRQPTDICRSPSSPRIASGEERSTPTMLSKGSTTTSTPTTTPSATTPTTTPTNHKSNHNTSTSPSQGNTPERHIVIAPPLQHPSPAYTQVVAPPQAMQLAEGAPPPPHDKPKTPQASTSPPRACLTAPTGRSCAFSPLPPRLQSSTSSTGICNGGTAPLKKTVRYSNSPVHVLKRSHSGNLSGAASKRSTSPFHQSPLRRRTGSPHRGSAGSPYRPSSAVPVVGGSGLGQRQIATSRRQGVGSVHTTTRQQSAPTVPIFLPDKKKAVTLPTTNSTAPPAHSSIKAPVMDIIRGIDIPNTQLVNMTEVITTTTQSSHHVSTTTRTPSPAALAQCC